MKRPGIARGGQAAFWLWLICFSVATFSAGAVQAAITTTGTVVPTYPGTSPDPWNVGGLLAIAPNLASTGTMYISSGSQVINTDGEVARSLGASGSVGVAGAGSIWENTEDLLLGVEFPSSGGGTGDLLIGSGGTVYVGDAARSGGLSEGLTVSDADSSGTAGGRLSLYYGSELIHGGHAIVGDLVDEYGWATVDGTDSAWLNSGWLAVGYYGTGTLNVRDGGYVSNTDAWLGRYSGSTGTATVDGADSTWTSTGNLSLGDSSGGGTGSLTISNGATVSVGDAAVAGGVFGWLIVSDGDNTSTDGGGLYIYNGSTLVHGDVAVVGDGVGEYGWATVDGVGSSWTNDEWLCIGYQGIGELIIENDATVSNTDAWLGYSTGGAGTVTVAGATWDCTGDLLLSNPVADSVGHVTISDGGTVFVGDAASSGGLSNWLTVSDANNSSIDGGCLWVYNGSTLTNGGGATIGDDANEYGWAIVDGASSSWTNDESLIVGLLGSGTLTIQNGAGVSNDDGVIGYATGATGTVTVDGAGSTWENTGDLLLGNSSDSGVGSLTISAGGTVYVGDAARLGGTAGWLTVSDVVDAGVDGGNLAIYNGSTVNAYSSTVGDGAGEFGWATIDGTDSSWSNDISLVVGNFGSGALAIQNGADVSDTNAWLGNEVDSVGTAVVDGAGSTWSSGTSLYVGYKGSGTLAVENHGSVSCGGDCCVGAYGFGMAVVEDHGSLSCGGTFTVGAYGLGTMIVRTGGNVSNTGGDAFIGRYGGSTGSSVTVGNGSSWNITGALWVGGGTNAEGVGDDALLTVEAGGAVATTGHFKVWGPGEVHLAGGTIAPGASAAYYVNLATGSLTGIGAVDGNLVNNGRVAPSGSTSPVGQLEVTGNYTQISGLLEIDLGGAFLGDYDRLIVDGTAALASVLEVSLVGLSGPVFEPDAGDTFDLFDWNGGVTGSFSTVTLPGLPAYLRWVVDDLYTSGELVVDYFTCPGDANLDGYVNETDSQTLAGHWGNAGMTWTEGDFDGDGLVGPRDASIMAAHWGYGAGPANAVPEPSTLVLLLLGMSMLLVRRGPGRADLRTSGRDGFRDRSS
ncbi:MAG: PEP-CTERM sorting domain-containing protein [Pirellulales bacterium]|nr:PEP-CTERM sorting domain-containing protein [Pirellulales bacterium]